MLLPSLESKWNWDCGDWYAWVRYIHIVKPIAMDDLPNMKRGWVSACLCFLCVCQGNSLFLVDKQISSPSFTIPTCIILEMSTTLKTENELPISNKKRRKGKCMPIYSETYYDDEGDLEIVSSDNVLFKLHAYQLQSSSWVALES